jgi:hypothetical protein
MNVLNRLRGDATGETPHTPSDTETLPVVVQPGFWMEFVRREGKSTGIPVNTHMLAKSRNNMLRKASTSCVGEDIDEVRSHPFHTTKRRIYNIRLLQCSS